MNFIGTIALIAGGVVIAVATIGLVFHIGYLLRDIRDKLGELTQRQEPPKPSVVTPLPPGYADATRPGAIVTPKSPAQVEREEEARIRALR